MTINKQYIKVLHILHSLGMGGAENWLRYIMRHINTEKYKIDVLVHDNKNDFIDEFAQYNTNIIYCPFKHNPFTYAKNLINYFHQYGPYDVVHSHLSSAGLHLFLAHHAGIPVRIAHCHTNDLLELRYSHPLRHYKLKVMQFLTRKYATAGFAISEQAMQRYGPHWQADPRWQVFSCGIDLAPFAEKADAKELREALGIPKDAFVVGHVGRFDPLKNHAFILKITKRLLERQPMLRLVLVGDGPLLPAARKQAEHLGIRDHVIFAGLRRDVPKLMKGAMDVFLLPSLSEGLPLVLMETQAAGLPAVVTDTITPEIEVISPLITRVSLQSPLDDWCDAVMASFQQKKSIDHNEISHLMELSKFNIKNSSNILLSLYEKYLTESNS